MNGNISEPPLFCDEAADDFTLDDQSPCAPAGNGCGLLMGAHGVGCGVASEDQTWGGIKQSFRGD